MLLIEYEQGVQKKPLKQGLFGHLFLREGKGRKEERGQRSKNTPPFFHQTFWGLKNGQEVVPPFWAPKFQFFKSAKKPLFLRDFQGKLAVHNLGGKGYVRKRAKQKKDNCFGGLWVWCIFELCFFGFLKKREGLGAAKTPPTRWEKAVFCQRCCCCCCLLLCVVVCYCCCFCRCFCCCFCFGCSCCFVVLVVFVVIVVMLVVVLVVVVVVACSPEQPQEKACWFVSVVVLPLSLSFGTSLYLSLLLWLSFFSQNNHRKTRKKHGFPVFFCLSCPLISLSLSSFPFSSVLSFLFLSFLSFLPFLSSSSLSFVVVRSSSRRRRSFVRRRSSSSSSSLVVVVVVVVVVIYIVGCIVVIVVAIFVVSFVLVMILVVLLLFVCFFVICFVFVLVLLSKLEAGTNKIKQKKGRPKTGTTSCLNQRGQLCLQSSEL